MLTVFALRITTIISIDLGIVRNTLMPIVNKKSTVAGSADDQFAMVSNRYGMIVVMMTVGVGGR